VKASQATWLWLVLLTSLATSGFATCGGDVAEERLDPESPGQAVEDELMEDDVRDSER
jgi:hypothetical protein